MTDLLLHDLPQAAHDLLTRLRGVLEDAGPAGAALRDRCRLAPSTMPRLVFTGQFSSGKSTLTLTDGAADVVIHPDIATDQVSEYDWDGAVVLVDTPGVKAGVDLHDERAMAALSAADLVLFAVTVSLFDDVSAAHLRDVAFRLGKADQLIVVITKSGTMRQPPADVRPAAIRDAWGESGALPPIVECDAGDYLTGLGHRDPERGRAYIESSGLAELTDALNLLAGRRGELGRLRQPFHLVRTLATEAESLFCDDPAEAAALALLARQGRALTDRRARIGADLGRLAGAFVSSAVRAAEQFADRMEELDDPAEHTRREEWVKPHADELRGRLNDAASTFQQGMDDALQSQLRDLASEVREIEAGGYARVVLDIARAPEVGPVEVDHTPDTGRTPGRAAPQGKPGWADLLGRHLPEFAERWGAGGGMAASSGTAGHRIVKDIGHAFGKKFRPWEAVRYANGIGNVLRVAGRALPMAIAVGEVVLEERRRAAVESGQRARRRDIVDAVAVQAREIAHDTTQRVCAVLDEAFDAEFARIRTAHDAVVGARQTRGERQERLAAIGTEADAWLAKIPTGGVGTG